MVESKILKIQVNDNKTIIEIMNALSNYFSPETIEFAEEKIPNLMWFVAKHNNKIVWFISFEIIDKIRSKIYWMWILPEYQHQWIGSILIKKLEWVLIEKWVREIELLTLDEHPDYPGYLFTREFYKKHGFLISWSYIEDDVKILSMIKRIW